MPTPLDDTLLSETLHALPGWEGDARAIWRDVHLTRKQDAELRRQIEVDADAMGHGAVVEERDGGVTRFVLTTEEEGRVTELDIVLASHISDLAHRIAADEPGVHAVREGDPVVIVRPAASDVVQEDL